MDVGLLEMVPYIPENLRRSLSPVNALHQKRLNEPDQVAKRLNQKETNDPKFKGRGHHLTNLSPSFHHAPQPINRQSIKANLGTAKDNFTPKTKQQKQQNPSKPKLNQPNPLVMQVQVKRSSVKPSHHIINRQQSVPKASYKMHTLNNIMNDPMDEMQSQCLELINDARKRYNANPVAFARICSQNEIDHIRRIASKEINICHDGLNVRQSKIPRCIKVGEVIAIGNSSSLDINNNNNNKDIKSKNINQRDIDRKNQKISSVDRKNIKANLNNHNKNENADDNNDVYIVKTIFDKWMKSATMRTSIIGDFHIVGIVFDKTDDGSTIGGALFAKITKQ